jgi:hypothetical protein
LVTLAISGASTVPSRVLFELSTDGINYSVLGEAAANPLAASSSGAGKRLLAPTATSFTLTGLNLPSSQNLFVRARGYDASGSEVIQTTRNAIVLSPTAATVSVGGRITSGKRGIRNIRVTLTDANGAARTVLSSQLGYYRFAEVEAGQTYTIQVSGKKYTFANSVQIRSITENTDDVDFQADN